MGKSKRRLIAKAKNNKNDICLTRECAINRVCQEIYNDTTHDNAKNLITLFGLSAEELAEAGLSYEILKSLGKTIT